MSVSHRVYDDCPSSSMIAEDFNWDVDSKRSTVIKATYACGSGFEKREGNVPAVQHTKEVSRTGRVLLFKFNDAVLS